MITVRQAEAIVNLAKEVRVLQACCFREKQYTRSDINDMNLAQLLVEKELLESWLKQGPRA